MQTIALFCNQLDGRGTGRAIFDYAYMLTKRGYQIKIVTRNSNISEHTRYLKSVFGMLVNFEFIAVDSVKEIQEIDCDIFYRLCSGAYEGIYHKDAKNVIHGVFEKIDDGGIDATKAYVSEWLATKHGSESFVPHIVYDKLDPQFTDFKTANHRLVVGRVGGYDTFDIPFVKDVVMDLVLNHSDKFVFDFVNTKPFWNLKEQIKMDKNRNNAMRMREYIDSSLYNSFNMHNYIGYCDCMLHARERGETFGISVGEFAVHDKPVLTFALSPEKAHIQHLKLETGNGYVYEDIDDLYNNLFDLYEWKSSKWKNREVGAYQHYLEFDAESVMDKFEEVFINA